MSESSSLFDQAVAASGLNPVIAPFTVSRLLLRVDVAPKQLTPESLAVAAAHKALETGQRLKDRAVGFAHDVRDNMAQREDELGEALGINAAPELPAPRRYPALENSNPSQYVAPPTHSYNRNEDH